MMAISAKDINAELTIKELETLSAILGERLSEMNSDLGVVCEHKYIEINQLYAKIEGFKNLIYFKKFLELNKS